MTNTIFNFELKGVIFRPAPSVRYFGGMGAMQGTGMAMYTAGAALQAYGTLQEGKEAAKAGKLQKKQYYWQAQGVREAGQYESRQIRKQGEGFEGTQVADISAQGGVITGGKLLMIADSAAEFEADARVTMQNATAESNRLKNIGMMAKYQGDVARVASRIRATADMTKAMGQMFMSMGGGGMGGGGMGAA